MSINIEQYQTAISSVPGKIDDFNLIQKKLDSFSKLPKGWDFGQGDSISNHVYNKARLFFEKVYCRYLDALFYDTVPTSNGGITLVFSKGDDFIDVTIKSDLTLDYKWEHGIGENYEIIECKENVNEKMTLDKILVVYQIHNEEWISSELCQLTNMFQESNVLRGLSPITTEVYQYLGMNVQSRLVEQSANT